MLSTFDQLLKELKENNDRRDAYMQVMQERLESYNLDEEIASRNKIIQNLQERSIYILTPKEAKADKEFRRRHYEETGCRNGTHYIYNLDANSLGVEVKITCPICGETKDITDIDSW